MDPMYQKYFFCFLNSSPCLTHTSSAGILAWVDMDCYTLQASTTLVTMWEMMQKPVKNKVRNWKTSWKEVLLQSMARSRGEPVLVCCSSLWHWEYCDGGGEGWVRLLPAERPSAGRPVSSVDNTAVFSRLSPADHCHLSLTCEYISQIQVT